MVRGAKQKVGAIARPYLNSVATADNRVRACRCAFTYCKHMTSGCMHSVTGCKGNVSGMLTVGIRASCQPTPAGCTVLGVISLPAVQYLGHAETRNQPRLVNRQLTHVPHPSLANHSATGTQRQGSCTPRYKLRFLRKAWKLMTLHYLLYNIAESKSTACVCKFYTLFRMQGLTFSKS